MPIRLQRGLRRQPRPASPLAASPADPAGAGCGLPGAPKLPQPAFLTTWGIEVRAGHETRPLHIEHGKPAQRSLGGRIACCGSQLGRNAGQAAAPEARSCCRKQLHGMRGRCRRTNFDPGAGRRFFLANQVSEWPFGSPWVRKGRTTENRRPDRCARRQVTASLFTSVHYCALLFGGGAPEQVSAHRPPFSLGLTTSAVRGSSRRPPGSFRCGQPKMNPC